MCLNDHIILFPINHASTTYQASVSYFGLFWPDIVELKYLMARPNLPCTQPKRTRKGVTSSVSWTITGQNRYPVYDQNGCKTPFFTAEHSHIAHKGSNPSPGCVWCIFIQSKTNLQFITVRQDSSRVCDLKLLFYRKHTEDVMLVVFSQLINGRKLNVWWRKRRGTIPFNWNANFILTDKQEVI